MEIIQGASEELQKHSTNSTSINLARKSFIILILITLLLSLWIFGFLSVTRYLAMNKDVTELLRLSTSVPNSSIKQ